MPLPNPGRAARKDLEETQLAHSQQLRSVAQKERPDALAKRRTLQEKHVKQVAAATAQMREQLAEAEDKAARAKNTAKAARKKVSSHTRIDLYRHAIHC